MDSKLTLIASTCHMQNARSRARQITTAYEKAFVPLELTGGQFSTLVAIGVAGDPPIHSLAERLGMDRTTMSRALKPLERRKLIALEPNPDDLRSKQAVLTEAGKNLLEQAIPLWEDVQNSIKE